MSLFLDPHEKEVFTKFRKTHAVGEELFWALKNRVEERAANPGLQGPGSSIDWWFCSAEYLTDAAMVHALKPSASVKIWLRDVTLSLIRRSEDDWVGPAFRDHDLKPFVGNLETAHLTWAVAVVLDLAPDIFSKEEIQEIRGILLHRGIPMCRRWLDLHNHLANWRCVLGAGIAVAASVLDDREEMRRAIDDYRISLQIFQPDGTYGESLQYSNYAAYALMLAREALIRRNPEFAHELPAGPWNLLPRWQAASLFYKKPLSVWGANPLPRCANFNDSAATFRPSGDLLLHLAVHEQTTHPKMAGLARWLFDSLYADNFAQGPHDSATFGFRNDYGFLSVPLLPRAVQALGPVEAGLGEMETFSCGDVIARDGWGGKTILAVHGGGDPLCGAGHLHGDINSFILVHNRERLLADPGHGCYRNSIHKLEIGSHTHNTCTFFLQNPEDLDLQEDRRTQTILEQSRKARIRFDRQTGKAGPPSDRGARRLIADRNGEVTVIGSEASALYGKPIEEFTRFWILCGSHALFVVDRIVSSTPVRTAWHWLLNNRDGKLELKLVPPDRLVARRGRAGMKLFHFGNGKVDSPEHAHLHDSYHPQPGGLGEGGSNSGVLVTWQEEIAVTERTVVHAIAVDGYGPVAGWHAKSLDGVAVLESPGATACWSVRTEEGSRSLNISESASGRKWKVDGDRLSRVNPEG